MDNPQGAKEPSSTQYVFHEQDDSGLITRLEAVGPNGERRNVELPYPMTLHVPSADGSAAGPQTAAHPGYPHGGGAQGTFLWSEVAAASGQPAATGPAMGPQAGFTHGPTPGPQFPGTYGPGTFGPAPGTHFAGMHGPHVAPPPGRTVKLQLTPPGFGQTMRLQPGPAPGTTMGFAPAPAMGGCVSGPAMVLHSGPAPGMAMGPQFGIAVGPAFGPAPHGPGTETGPRT